MLNSYPITIGTAMTTDGSYPATPGYVIWPGGSGTLVVWGTYNGATITFEVAAPNSSTFVALQNGAFDANNLTPATITLGENVKLRGTISNDGASTSLNAMITPILQ